MLLATALWTFLRALFLGPTAVVLEDLARVLGQAEATLSVSEMCGCADTRRRDHGPRVHAAFPATNALLPLRGVHSAAPLGPQGRR
jgi:hypothetical protein